MEKVKRRRNKKKKIKEAIDRLFKKDHETTNKIGDKFCNYITKNKGEILIKKNNSDDDDSQDGHKRIYTRLRILIVNLFEKYIDNRNKLFTNIISKIFVFNEENNDEIININDDITYKEIFEYTIDAKIIILDMYLEFINFIEQFIITLEPIPQDKNDDDQYYLLYSDDTLVNEKGIVLDEISVAETAPEPPPAEADVMTSSAIFPT